MRSILATIITIAALSASFQTMAATNGEVRQSVEHGMQAWDGKGHQWLTLEGFWNNYAKSHKQKNWPASATYPKLEALSEGDTFLVQLKDSSCLMEFYHSRWRRANDVHRWDDAFNAYGACPFVFEE
jgi:hypothetical protein